MSSNRVFVAVLALSGLIHFTARAADSYLTGPSWLNAANWTNGIPTASTTARVNIVGVLGGSAPFEPATQAYSADLFIGGAADLTMSQNLSFSSTNIEIGSGVSDQATLRLLSGAVITNTNLVTVGKSGTSQFQISYSKLKTGSLTMGLNSGSQGSVTIGGNTSNLEIAGGPMATMGLAVGQSGNGTLNITSTGSVYNTSIYNSVIGESAGGVGKISIQNSSQLQTTKNLVVGLGGSGTLELAASSVAINSSGIVANAVGSIGNVSVSGTDSLWQNTTDLTVGNSGTARMDVLAAGRVTNKVGIVAQTAGSSTVYVSGTSSEWANTTSLTIGVSGTGKLAVADSGKVTVNGGSGIIELAANASSSGEATIGGLTTAEPAGILNASEIHGGSGSAKLIFNHTNAAYTFQNVAASGILISGSTHVDVSSGDTILTRANTYTGGTSIVGGTLTVNNTSGSGTGTGSVLVGSDGELRGMGQVFGPTTIAGKLSPGDGIGSINFSQSLSLTETTVLSFQLGAPTDLADRVFVGGDLTLDGTLQITNVGSFGAGTYTLFFYDGALINDGVTITGLPNGLAGSLDFASAGRVRMIVAVPEPSTVAMLGAALVGLFAFSHRRKP